MAGISRSVTIVIAYLLKKFKYSLGEIITMLQRKRSKVEVSSFRSTPIKASSSSSRSTQSKKDSNATLIMRKCPVPKKDRPSRGKLATPNLKRKSKNRCIISLRR